MSTTYKTIEISDVNVFYRESGDKANPTLLLLHGFPTSSRQFQTLIPLLNHKFHIIAPDLPGFGQTKIPASYDVSFDSIAKTIEQFLQALSIDKFSVYVFDYGAPTGFRLALSSKFTVTGIISQNGNAYEEGLTSFWDPLKIVWALLDKKEPLTPAEETKLAETNKVLAGLVLDYEPYHQQYYEGEPDTSVVNPEDPLIDLKLLSEYPNTVHNQLALFADYRNNIALYPKFHQYFASSNVPILAVWGVNDTIFGEPGQKAYAQHSKNVKIVDIDGGHFLSATHPQQVAAAILEFSQEYEL